LEYAFLGPAPVRNFQPIQLIFLQLPFERTRTVGRGHLGIDVDTAEINVIEAKDGPIESRLKFETNRTVLGLRYGLAPAWEVSMHLPLISRFGGFLDPIIDEFESLFGAGNPQRDLYPNNSFGDFYVRRDDVEIFGGGKETLAPGDLWFTVKRELRWKPKWPLFGVRAAIKAPTGSLDKVTGSGKPDFGLGLLAEYRVLSPLILYLNFNVIYPLGPITPVDLTLNPMVSESFAMELALTSELGAFFHQAAYTSPMHGTGRILLDEGPVEVGFGFNWVVTNNLALQLAVIQNVSEVEAAADATVLLAAKVEFPVVRAPEPGADSVHAPLPAYPPDAESPHAPLPEYP
jgi:hypothetical protein